MKVIVCVDDNGGVMFNHRRQSQDRVLRERILERAGGARLWVSPYSAKQFTSEQQARLFVSDPCLARAGEGIYCFAEGEPLAPHRARLEEIVLYRWNRAYPADTFLDIALPGPDWELAASVQFQGSSHPGITEEVYRKKDL